MPISGTLGVYEVKRALESSETIYSEEPLCFNLQDLTFIRPVGFAFLAACCDWRTDRHLETTITPPKKPDVLQYLQRMDFFHSFGIGAPEAFRRYDPQGQFVELQRLERGSPVGRTVTRITEVLYAQRESATFKLIEFCLGETIGNALQHSGSRAFVCAQKYQEKYAHLAVADFGIGIREHLKQKYPDIRSDRDAIDRALCWRTTGHVPSASPYASSQNLGCGLPMTREVVRSLGGRLYILSYKGFMVQFRRDLPDYSDVGVYRGTIISMQVNTTLTPSYDSIISEAWASRGGTVADHDIFG